MDYKQLITNKAHELGFFHVGFSKADFLEEEAPRLEKWLNNHYQGEMAYMANHFDKRLDPRLLVDDAQTVISSCLIIIPTNNKGTLKHRKFLNTPTEKIIITSSKTN